MSFLIVFATLSSPLALTVCVAPKVLANSSLASLVSTATIVAAPAMAQPCTALSPTPPAPKTTQVEPGATLAVLIAAPTPVMTPQPTSAQRSSGVSSVIFTTLSVCSVAYSAITPQPEKTLSRPPAASLVRTLPSGSVHAAFAAWSHSCGRPVTHQRQRPHMLTNELMTRSPTA